MEETVQSRQRFLRFSGSGSERYRIERAPSTAFRHSSAAKCSLSTDRATLCSRVVPPATLQTVPTGTSCHSPSGCSIIPSTKTQQRPGMAMNRRDKMTFSFGVTVSGLFPGKNREASHDKKRLDSPSGGGIVVLESGGEPRLRIRMRIHIQGTESQRWLMRKADYVPKATTQLRPVTLRRESCLGIA